MKKCIACQKHKHIGYFYYSRSDNRYSSYCIECHKKLKTERRRKDNDEWMTIICGEPSFMRYYFDLEPI